jgi:hypothetical protein
LNGKQNTDLFSYNDITYLHDYRANK